MSKKLIALLCAVVMLFALAACSSTQQGGAGNSGNAGGDNVVKIGVLMPLSGANATAGEYQLNGIEMVKDYINANGGIESMGGATIELVVSDTAGDVENGMTEMERLITVENVTAVVGPYNSNVAAATAPIAIQYGVPYVITNAIADNIMQSSANKYVYRSNYGASDMEPFRRLVIEYLGSLTNAGKLSKIAIVYDVGDWGVSENETFTSVANELGIDVVVSEPITTDSSDLSSVVNKIKNSDAEVVFCGIFLNDAILFAQQMREYNCDVQIVGSGAGFSDAKWLEAIGSDANGIMGTSDFSPAFGTKNDESAALYETYLAEHNGVAMPLETSNGFCGMGTIVEALRAAGSADREAVADALYSLDLATDSLPLWFSMFDGINFNTDGDALGRYNQNTECGETAGQILKQVINGKWELVWPSAQATADIQFGG